MIGEDKALTFLSHLYGDRLQKSEGIWSVFTFFLKKLIFRSFMYILTLMIYTSILYIC